MQGPGKIHPFKVIIFYSFSSRIFRWHVCIRTKPKPPKFNLEKNTQTERLWFLKHFLSSSCSCALNFSCQETATPSFLFPIFTSAQFLILTPNIAFLFQSHPYPQNDSSSCFLSVPEQGFSFHYIPLQTWKACLYTGLPKLKLSFYKNSWARKSKSMDQVIDHQQRPSITCQTLLTVQAIIPESGAMPETNPSPQNSVPCTRLPQELENRADELMQAPPLLSNFIDTVSSAVVWKSSWGCPSDGSTLAAITLFCYVAFWVSPGSLGRPLPALDCTNVQNTWKKLQIQCPLVHLP